MDETPLDRAHRAMEAGGDVDRLRFYERLADAQLFLLLAAGAEGDRIEPQTYPVDGETYALVFDLIDRLAEFAGASVPYAALSGRATVELMKGQGVGLALNLGTAPSAILLPATAVDWLAGILRAGTEETAARPIELRTLASIAPEMLEGLHLKLALVASLAQGAYLADVRYDDGHTGVLLGFLDVLPGSEHALQQAVSEALIFSGAETGEIDIVFLASKSPIAERLARVGLRVEMPDPDRPERLAPGTDPSRPPRLR